MKLLLLFALALSLSLQAREVVDSVGSCQINWTQGSVTCEGESAEGQNSFAAKISAKVIAQRNLLEVIKGVRIDSELTIKDGMFDSDVIRSRVEGNVRGGQVISNVYDSNLKSAVATIKLEMGKDLLASLLSDPTQLSWNEKIQRFWSGFTLIPNANASTYTNRDKATIEKLLADLRKRGDAQGEKYLTTILSDLSSTVHSGVLIDVSGIENFKKAMIVRLVDESGAEIYPANVVSKNTLLKKNTSVGYMYGFEDARNNKRVFNSPVEIKATSVYKKRYSNVVLTQEQLKKIKSLDKEILKNAKVILVLGD